MKLILGAILCAFIIFGFMTALEREQTRQVEAELQITKLQRDIATAEAKVEIARQDNKTLQMQTFALTLVALTKETRNNLDILVFCAGLIGIVVLLWLNYRQWKASKHA